MAGTFIAFEGGEGSGKSTQSRLLYSRLIEEGHTSLLLHEPGGTALGEEVRRLLLVERGDARRRRQARSNIAPLAELLLFSAARAELVSSVLRPALQEGRVVVCDRYTDSTIAYQGYGRGLPLETIDQANRLATGGLQPDLMVFLDIHPADALQRVSAQMSLLQEPGAQPGAIRQDEDGLRRFEREPMEFHQKVRQGYRDLSAAEPARWLVVDGSLPVEHIAALIWERVEPLVRGRGRDHQS